MLHYCEECQKEFSIEIRVICDWGFCRICEREALVNVEMTNCKQCKPCLKNNLIKITGWRGKHCYKCGVCGRIHPIKRVNPDEKS